MSPKEHLNRKKFSAELSQLPAMLAWIRDHLDDLEAKMVRRIELASEEALVNIMDYAYPLSQPGEVEITCSRNKSRVQIQIRDWGIPSEFLENLPPLQKNLPLIARKEGGIGLHLMRQIMDQVIYRREEDTNLLTLIKQF